MTSDLPLLVSQQTSYRNLAKCSVRTFLTIAQIDAAVSFLLNYLPQNYHQSFHAYLTPRLEYIIHNNREQLLPIWNNINASAHRTLKVMQARPDRLLGETLQYLGLEQYCIFPEELVIFIEPDCVSLKLNDDRQVQILWSLPEELDFATVYCK